MYDVVGDVVEDEMFYFVEVMVVLYDEVVFMEVGLFDDGCIGVFGDGFSVVVVGEGVGCGDVCFECFVSCVEYFWYCLY